MPTIMNSLQIKHDGASYVKDMDWHPHIMDDNTCTVSLGKLDAANVEIGALTVASGEHYDLDITVKAPFGRNIGITTTNNGRVTLYGLDYLGQVVTRNVDIATTATFHSFKSFKYLTGIKSETVDGDITILNGLRVALPFCGIKPIRELTPTTMIDSGLGLFYNPDESDATSDTDDTRSAYIPKATLDGETEVIVTYMTSAGFVDGLLGRPQA